MTFRRCDQVHRTLRLRRRSINIRAAALLVATLVIGSLSMTTASAAAPSPSPLGSRVATGAWVDGMDSDPSRLDQFDQSIGRATTIASVYRGYGEVFPSAADVALTDGGARSLLVAWYLDVDRFTGFTSGAHDAYLDSEAAVAKAYGRTIYIRPWAEMNGDWQDFQPTSAGSAAYGGTPTQFIAAWQYVVNRFRQDGANNVSWVFNPTADTYAGTTDVATIWPGAAYVDVLGIDGYNWGNGGALAWTSFAGIFTTQYDRLTALDPSAPVWICEFGSKEPQLSDGAPIDANHSKAKWYTDALASTAFPMITTLVFFEADKERDWLVDSSAASLTAVRTGLQAPTTPIPTAPSSSGPSGGASASGSFVALTPHRLLDTRTNLGAPASAPSGTIAVQVTGSGPNQAPAGASAVVLNVTATSPTRAGYLTAYADNTTRPLASNLNFAPGQTVANLIIVPVGADGKVDLFNGSTGTTQLIADISGYYVTS